MTLDTKMQKAIIAMPSARGDIRVEAMASVINNISVLREMDITAEFVCVTYAEASVARNRLAAAFLNTNADWIIMQDDDVSIDTSIVKRIFAFEQDFIGVFLPQRQLNLDKFAGHIKSGLSVREARIRAAKNVGLGENQSMDNSIYEVNSIGGGFLVLHRRVFQKILKHGSTGSFQFNTPSESTDIYGFFNNITNDGSFIGEDYSFCERYKKAGGKIFAYNGPGITHHGSYGFSS